MATYRTWQEARDDCHVPDDWNADLDCWPEWTWAHLTDSMLNGENNLPFRLIYAVLVERSGLAMPTRALLQFLARQCGGSNRPDRRCWPKVRYIGDGIGAARATVQRAVKDAEAAGWVRVVRHRQKPSDYVLDVPEYDRCPCIDCREGYQSEALGYQSEALEGQSEAPGYQDEPSGVSERATHLMQSPGSAPDSPPDASHLRAAPNGAGTEGAEKLDRYKQGQSYAQLIAEDKLSMKDAEQVAETIADNGERREFLAAAKAGRA